MNVVMSRSWKGIPRWDVDLTMFPNLSKNSNWWSVLVQGWPMLGQQQKHTWTTSMMTKDGEQQKDKNANKEQQNANRWEQAVENAC